MRRDHRIEIAVTALLSTALGCGTSPAESTSQLRVVRDANHCVARDGLESGCVGPGSCIINTCDDAGCVETVEDAGTPCDDGNACTFLDQCQDDGGCMGTTQNCGLCQACDGDGGCNADVGLNGNGCTDSLCMAGTCSGGQCTGQTYACNSTPCQSEACVAGICVPTDLTGACDGGSACQDFACQFGSCVPVTGGQCGVIECLTAVTCGSGCTYAPNPGVSCDAGWGTCGDAGTCNQNPGPDAGVDAGVGGTDAGADAGQGASVAFNPFGCGCSGGTRFEGALALGLLAWVVRRPRKQRA